MNFHVRKADRGQAKPLIGLYGQSGSGKTYSALLLARGFSPKGRVIMIETEAGRGEAYVDMIEGGYEVVSIRNNFSPKNYGDALTVVEEAKADVLIIDSASHEWSGAGGVLSMAADNQEKGLKGVLVWQKPKTSHSREFMLRLLQTAVPLVILCLRAKYPMIEKKLPDGRKEWVRSEILEPDQAADILFELFVHGWLDQEHRLHVTKWSRPDLREIIRDNEPITIETGRRLAAWATGTEPPRGKVAAVKAAPASKSSPEQEAGAAETDSERVNRLDRVLADAAELGEDELKRVWNTIDKADRKTLRAALDRRHKPRAAEVDLGQEVV